MNNKMQLIFSPSRCDKNLVASKTGEVLTINGVAFDFSPVPEGATLPVRAVDCEFVDGPVERINGALHITLMLPHGANANEAVRFPSVLINPPDGPLELPQ